MFHVFKDYSSFQLPELAQFSVGLMHIQLLHTSASLAINENWDPDVRDDMEMMLNRIVPEDLPFRHSCEGPDDMVSALNLLSDHHHVFPYFAACPRESLLPWVEPNCACIRWQTQPGHLARGVAL